MLLPCLIAGSLLLSTAIVIGITRQYRRARESSGWPAVPGKLLQCELRSRRSDDGPGDVYDLAVQYAYEFEGSAYESQTIQFYFGQWGSERGEYEDLERRITTAPSLAVYVNPRNPREAVLFPGTSGMNAGNLVGWSLLAIAGPLCGVVAIYVLFLR